MIKLLEIISIPRSGQWYFVHVFKIICPTLAIAVTLYGPSQVWASFPAFVSRMLPTAFLSTRSPVLNSLTLTP